MHHVLTTMLTLQRSQLIELKVNYANVNNLLVIFYINILNIWYLP